MNLIDKRIVTYRYASTFVREDFDRDNVANKADTLPKLYLSATRETNTASKSHRQRQPRRASHTKLSIDEWCG